MAIQINNPPGADSIQRKKLSKLIKEKKIPGTEQGIDLLSWDEAEQIIEAKT